MRKGLGLLALGALPLLSGGCLTPAMWNAYTDDEIAQESGPGTVPERIERAVHTPGGDIHVESLFADASLRYHRWDAVLHDELRPMQGSLPQGVELWVHRVGAPEPLHRRTRIRLRGTLVELDEGEGYQSLARYPTLIPSAQNPVHAATASTARAVIGGVALGVATPVTVALDVAGGATIVALSPILLPLYMVFSG